MTMQIKFDSIQAMKTATDKIRKIAYHKQFTAFVYANIFLYVLFMSLVTIKLFNII
jgi:hypothetical protein